MKQVTVKTVSGQVQVKIDNASSSDALTAGMALVARSIAFLALVRTPQ